MSSKIPTSSEAEGQKSLEEDCGWVSSIFMLYLDRLFAKGNVKSLESEDLGHISQRDRTELLVARFRENYEEYVSGRERGTLTSLWHPLLKTTGYGNFVMGILMFFISAVLGFGPVLLMNRLVKHFDGETHETDVAVWIMVVLLFVFPMSSSVFLAHSNAITSHIGCQCRNILVDVIYRKSLVISPRTKLVQSTGRIITMFSDDTNQIRTFFFMVANTIIAPFQIAVCLYLIYQQVGTATFVGLGYTFLTMPLTGITFGLINKWRAKKMSLTDMRVKFTNEVLAGIRVIKYYAWEEPIINKIVEIRVSELNFLRKMGYMFSAVFAILMLGAPQIQVVCIFVVYILLGNDLDVATAFTTMTLFNIMTMPFVFLPFGLQQYSQCRVAMIRICQFLESGELEGYVLNTSEKDVDIHFAGANLCWTPAEDNGDGEPESDIEDKSETIDVSTKAAYTTLSRTEEANEDQFEVLDGGGSNGASESSLHATPLVNTRSVNKTANTLVNLDVKISQGQLVGIVGGVGSGKSSFLSALLGEMHLQSGSVSVRNDASIAFCDQRPFVVNATLKDNILFHKEFDEKRFDAVVDVVCMADDVKMLTHGVMTEIGERGITLSGGQKARVSLARAVYSDADIFLFDDPLSAVDAHVGEDLFNRCIKDYLKGKTRLLVTHHVRVLPHCDFIIILDDNGSIVTSGSYEEVMKSGINLEKYIVAKEENTESDEVIEDKLDNSNVQYSDPSSPKNRERSSSQISHTSDIQPDLDLNQTDDKEGKNLMSIEEKNEGAVEFSTYWVYMQYGGISLFVIAVCFQVIAQVCQLSASFWLIHWGQTTSNDYRDHGEEMPRSESFEFLTIYAVLVLGTVSLWAATRMTLTYHRTLTAKIFHNKLVSKVLFFPVSFFDTTPIGRIINRFSHDMSTIDEQLAQSLSQCVTMGANVLTSLIAIVAATKGVFLLVIVPLSYLYVRFNIYFKKSHTAIARLEAISRSPIYADFSESLTGTTTIRAYKKQEMFSSRLEHFANLNTVPALLQQLSLQWLSIRLDFIGAVILFFMGSLTAALSQYSFIPAGFLALGLSYAISLTTVLKMVVRVLAQLEAHFSSVERIRHYIENDHGLDGRKRVPKIENTEASSAVVSSDDVEMAVLGTSNEDFTPPTQWPEFGKIEFRNVYMRYRDNGDCVLKGVSFTVDSLAKIGICGRTGCGKSSLMVALFRIEELVSGTILIDDVDISRVPVQYLRSKLAIIPQEPVLFSASLRFNLDPFNQCTDEEIWDVLRDVNMESYVNSSLPLKLQELVSEGGDNFSAGQRQLICIGRAVLRKLKILVMDEATASIDRETDTMIQKMIRVKFKACTVLTIAHRLNTIIDSSRILVMNEGISAEFDTPEVLLDTPEGIFRGLWDKHLMSDESGPTEEDSTSQMNRMQSLRNSIPGASYGK